MRSYALVFALVVAAAFGLVGGFAGCGQVENIHETDEGRNNPCVSCHRSAFVAAANPKHLGITPEMPDTCQDCHVTTAWTPTTVEDHGKYGFPIENKHAPPPAGLIQRTECIRCHTKGYRQGDTSKDCVSCHQKHYDEANAKKLPARLDGHAPLLPTACGDCHDTKGWKPLSRNIHESETAKTTICSACHINDYNAAANPTHVGVFPTQCAGCHQTTAWRPAISASHDWFPLNNKHAQQQCITCHKNNVFTPGSTPNTCIGCHQASYDFAVANVPGHSAFPAANCTGCHSDAGWKPFVHGWPLTGKHATLLANGMCTSCHTQGPPLTAPKPSKECFSCHQANYNAAANTVAGHSAFPTVCTNCHTPLGWKPALNGAHPDAKFRISSGAHSKFTCVDCHNPTLGSAVKGANCDCVGCHTGKHTRTSMDAKHRGVNGYPAGAAPPNFCLSCHPDGRH